MNDIEMGAKERCLLKKCRMSLMPLSRSMSLSKSGCSSTMSNWMSLMDGPPDEDKRKEA